MNARKSFFLFLLATLAACHDKDDPAGTDVQILSETVQVNPSGAAPLTGRISLLTSFEVSVSLRVAGKHGAASDVVKEFNVLSTDHDIPVLGLYPGTDNTVELTFTAASGASAGKKSFTLSTEPLPQELFPQITIDKTSDNVVEGMTFVSYFGYKGNANPQHPFIFDKYGDIRWYAEFTGHGILGGLFYDDGMERLQNGNLYFGDGATNAVYEMDFLGNILHVWNMPGFGFHHNVQEKPDGNFLVTVNKLGLSTTEDFIIEIDRNTHEIIREWDLRESLQYGRQALTTNTEDWIHANAVFFDASDNTIIVSGRTQGTIKLDMENHVVWILGCHKDWGLAGDGTDLNQFLLQPLDHNDQPITDPDVLLGNINHPDFEWNWFQHAPKLMPNGNVLLFDNGGSNRNFSGTNTYSRAVEFDIDEANMTVRQVWDYGKNRGGETKSNIVSDVDFHPDKGHVIFSPGAVNYGSIYGKAIEIDYLTKEVLFEATMTPYESHGITLHRTQRMTLYPE